MKTIVRVALAAAVAWAPLSAAGATTYLYDFRFDAQPGYAASNIVYEADSFTTPFLTYKSGNLNGYTGASLFNFGQGFQTEGNRFGPVAGKVVALTFYMPRPLAEGTYQTQLAGRGVSLGPDLTSYSYGTGSLTVSAAPTGAVPEAATWAMMVIGFGVTGTALRQSHRRRTQAA